MTEQTLGARMRALAATGHSRAAELLALAAELEDAAANYTTPGRLVGSWARARRLWQEVTGEPIMSQATIDATAKLARVLGRKP